MVSRNGKERVVVGAVADRMWDLVRQVRSMEKEVDSLDRRARYQLGVHSRLVVFARSDLERAVETLSGVAHDWSDEHAFDG